MIHLKKIHGVDIDYTSSIELTASGNDTSLSLLKTMLTVKNKSIEAQISSLKRIVPRNQRHGAAIYNQIQELKQKESHVMWAENENGSISLPPGYWFLGDMRGTQHLGNVSPVFMDDERYYQREIVSELLKYKRSSVVAATGCHAKDTEILMFDGSKKKAEDIQIGNLLMGPDSTPRTVTKLIRGKEAMYKITPLKGEPWIVNKNHILSLKKTGTGNVRTHWPEIENVSVEDYLKWSKTRKHIYKQYYADCLEFDYKTLPIDPYILGTWLGDGSCRELTITTMDSEIKDYWHKWAASFEIDLKSHKLQNTAPNYSVSDRRFSRSGNPAAALFKKMNLFYNKHIPLEFKTASIKDRLSLLAGLIDTDGSLIHGGNVFDIGFANETLAFDVIDLARSLGFMCTWRRRKTDYIKGIKRFSSIRITVSGHTELIPTLLKRKQARPRLQKKNHLVCGFSVSELPEDNFYGFSVDKDRLYVMGNFVVTHNCGKSRIIRDLVISHRKAGRRVIVCVPSIELLDQTAETVDIGLAHIGDSKCGRLGDGRKPKDGAHVVLSTIQSALNFVDRFQVVIMDELHVVAAESYQAVCAAAVNAEYMHGLTATIDRPDGLTPLIHAWCGPVVYEYGYKKAVEEGFLSPIQYHSKVLKSKARVHKNMHSIKEYIAVHSDKTFIDQMESLVAKSLNAGRKTLVLFKASECCEALAVRFGVQAANGNFRKPLEDFKKGASQLLIGNVALLSTGWDDIYINSIIFAAAGTSEIVFFQSIGRGTRIAPGKKDCVVIDVSPDHGKYMNQQKVRGGLAKKAGYEIHGKKEG